MTTKEWQEFRAKCERYHKDICQQYKTIKKGSVVYKSVKAFDVCDHICQPQDGGEPLTCKKSNCIKLKK